MQHLNRPVKKTDYDRSGNVIWLNLSAKRRDSRRVDPVDSLRQSVTRLVGEVERSGRLKTDIGAALVARRYELYRRSATLGAHAPDRSLAAAERTHVGSLLRFVHAIAAADSEDRRGRSGLAARIDHLAGSIRELEINLERARQLSQDMLAQCRSRGRRAGSSPLAESTH